MEREELCQVIFKQQKDFAEIKNLVERDKAKEIMKIISLKMPIVITGVRRCGKSSLLKIIKNKLELKEKEFLYINFNDERLINFKTSDFQKILDYIEENNYKKNSYLFIDEIQETENWEKWVDRIKKDYHIFITGSNSKLLSKEISTILTGRSINISLFPFSFKEFLNSKNISTTSWKLDLNLQAKIRKEFNNFLNFTAMPQPVMTNQKILISELYENILYRDIIRRFNKNLTKPIKEISLYLLSNIASDLSLRTLSKVSEIKNISTMKEIVNAFEDAFLFFSTSKYDYSIKKQIQNPKKIYCIDNGFGTAIGFKFSEDKGKLLENAIAIELKRQNKEIYYFRENSECDFAIKKGIKITELIQVCYDLNEKNKKREIKGLTDSMNKFKVKQGLILTNSSEEEFIVDGKRIIVKPAWKWVMESF